MQGPIIKICKIKPWNFQRAKLEDLTADLVRSGQSRREANSHILAKAWCNSVLVEDRSANRHTRGNGQEVSRHSSSPKEGRKYAGRSPIGKGCPPATGRRESLASARVGGCSGGGGLSLCFSFGLGGSNFLLLSLSCCVSGGILRSGGINLLLALLLGLLKG